MSPLVVNFFGGPGISKSTVAAHVFAELKWLGINCELATEYAKEKVWEESFEALKDQRLVYGKQYHMIWRLLKHVEVVLSDSPLLLSLIYGDKESSEALKNLVIEDFNKFNNLNFLLLRNKPYVQSGRMQTEAESIEKDKQIQQVLFDNKIEYFSIEGKRENVTKVVGIILSRIGKSHLR